MDRTVKGGYCVPLFLSLTTAQCRAISPWHNAVYTVSRRVLPDRILHSQSPVNEFVGALWMHDWTFMAVETVSNHVD
jgi:hypothetical protein